MKGNLMETPNITEKMQLTEQEFLRLLFLEADFLVTDIEIDEELEDLPEGISLPVKLSEATPTMAEWLDEERGDY